MLKKVFTLALVLMTAPVSGLANTLFDQYGFDAAAAAHDGAYSLTSEVARGAVGGYKMIATTSRSYRGDFQKKEMSGIANPDGSILSLLLNVQSSGDLIQVMQYNLAKRDQNQGPSVVEFNDVGTMVFAQYSYRAGAISSDVFFYSECKLLADQSLLCAKRFMVQDVSKVNPQQAAMHNTIVGYDLYIRQ